MTSVILAPINLNNHLILDEIVQELEKISKLQFIIKPLKIDISEAYSIERGQYYSTKILNIMSENFIAEDSKVVGIIKKDLYIPVLTYVFGEAQLDGKFSLVSLFRLDEEFYSDKSDKDLLKQRTIKEILHELGHNFGLIHCPDWDCVMHSASSIEEVDIRGFRYCKQCNKQIMGKMKF